MQADELPPPVQMVQLLAGFQLSQALYAAAALGVADHLVAGPAQRSGSPQSSRGQDTFRAEVSASR